MRILLDTHTFLWFADDNLKLSDYAVEVMTSSDADLLLSTASLWEIAIKVNLKKLVISDRYEVFIPEQFALNSFKILPISFDHLKVVESLYLHHRDPFDRLLIAQSIQEKIPIISADARFDDYDGVKRYG